MSIYDGERQAILLWIFNLGTFQILTIYIYIGYFHTASFQVHWAYAHSRGGYSVDSDN